MGTDEIGVIGVIGVIGEIGGEQEEGVLRSYEAEGTGRGRRGYAVDVRPEGLRRLAQRIGDKRAGRVWRLMERGVVGTVPELCTYDWLKRRPWLVFEFQSSQMGGRMMAGGAVVDFIISGLNPDGLYIWRIQGEYWHQGREAKYKDEAQKVRLLGLEVGGVPVVQVVDLWEMDIYDRYPEVFERAEFGMGLRGGEW